MQNMFGLAKSRPVTVCDMFVCISLEHSVDFAWLNAHIAEWQMQVALVVCYCLTAFSAMLSYLLNAS